MGAPGPEDDDDRLVGRVVDDDLDDEDPEEEEEEEDPEEEAEEENEVGEVALDEKLDEESEEEVDEFEEEEEAVEDDEEVADELEPDEAKVDEGEDAADDLEEGEEEEEEDAADGLGEEEEVLEDVDAADKLEEGEEEVEEEEDASNELEQEEEEEDEEAADDLEEDEEEVEEEEDAADELEQEEEEEEDEEAADDLEEDEEEVEEDEEEVEEAEEAAGESEEDEVELENNEEAVKKEDAEVEDHKPLIPPIASVEDATDGLSGKKHIGIKTDADAPGSATEDTEDIRPLIFTETETLKNENVDCAYKGAGVNETESDYGKNETSQLVSNKDAKDTEYCAAHGDSMGFEAAELLSTNLSISIEPGYVKYGKVDCASEGNGGKEMQSDGERESCQHISNKDAEDTNICAHHSDLRGIKATKFVSSCPPISIEAGSIKNEAVIHACEGKGVKRMDSDCEEKEIFINKKVAESTDVYSPSSEAKCTAEIVKPLCTMGLDSDLVLMQEGGVEDMDLDSEENIVRGSDDDGTVVDSIQENIALNSLHESSVTAGANALNSMTVVTGNVMSSSFGGKDTMHIHELKLDEGNNMNLGLKEHTYLKPSSMAATSVKQRSLPPVTQLMDSNKRPAIICNYYANGWCIKGNSCRFLHVKENKDNTIQQRERGLASANGEIQVCEGVGDSSKTVYSEQHAESHIRQSNNKFGYSSLESQLLHSAKPEFGSGVVASSSSFAGRLRPSSVNTTHMVNDPLQEIANRYINQHLNPLVATDVYSSRYITPVNGSSNSIISLNSNPFDAHKILSGSIDFNASSSSLGLRSQWDRLNSLGLAPKAEMYKWEPSKPFRPSYYFSIPSGLSPGSMYDPLRDSIEHASSDVGSFRAEPINYPSDQKYPVSASAGNHFEMDGYNGTVLDRYGHSHVTGLPVTEAEAAESYVADQCNLGSALGGDKGSGTSHGKDLSETNKTNTVSAEKESKLIKEKIHGNGVDVDRESKTYRHFRVALIEFTKELLKPAWRVGNLSKDAHNLIVKKTVKKVLSSLHIHQVPSTPESAQQYLSASEPKITKLLEAYVQKHSKT